MEDLLLQLVEGTSGVVSYLVVFGILLACGLGVPLPEDVSLILGGYLAHAGKANLWVMMITGFVGIMVGDSIIFFAGRRIGSQVGNRKGGFFARIVTPEKRARVEQLFHKHGDKIVCLARFMPGVRAVTFFTAGSVGMKYLRFLFFDGAAALVSAPVFIYLGFRFGGELETLLHNVKKGQTRVILVLVAVAVVYLGYFLWKRRRDKATAAAALAQLNAQAVIAAVQKQPEHAAPAAHREPSSLI
ncbi:MAG: DedA family protein [Myxococcaceae bacterium]|nr:DedA family protein [Myxococcaceae bacterium]